jgi:mRNA interferase MazF
MVIDHGQTAIMSYQDRENMVRQFEIWIADLNPRIGTEPGKTRPVLVIQTNLLNKAKHPSTIVCPLTTKVQQGIEILRVRISKTEVENLQPECDIMIDQLRAIDNKRLIRKIGVLPPVLIEKVKENISILLDLQ